MWPSVASCALCVRQRVHTSGAVGVDELRTQLAAIVFDTGWSAPIASSAALASVPGTFRARIRAMHLRSVAVASVHDHWV